MARIVVTVLFLWTSIVASATVINPERFDIVKDGKATPIVIDENDWKGVLRAANNLSDDVRKVTGVASPVKFDTSVPLHQPSIIVGTIGKSQIIDKLIKKKKLNVKQIKDRWEAYVITVVDDNMIIAGSDKRGTIYGIYTLSEYIGVSPWYWMADAPIVHKDELWYNYDVNECLYETGDSRERMNGLWHCVKSFI